LALQKTDEYKGKLAAEIAEEIGILTPERKKQALLNQAKARADAAEKDFDALRKGETIEDLPSPFLGRNGQATPIAQDNDPVNAAVAIANTMETIVLTDKERNEKTSNKLFHASNMIGYIENDKSINILNLTSFYRHANTIIAQNVSPENQSMALQYLDNRKTEVLQNADIDYYANTRQITNHPEQMLMIRPEKVKYGFTKYQLD
jgi:hypothetical protein